MTVMGTMRLPARLFLLPAPVESSTDAPVSSSAPTSSTPSTGDAGIAAFAVLALIALAGVVVVKKAR